MKLAALVCALTCLGLWSPATLASPVHAPRARWIRLYSGKDLSGWHSQGGWLEVWKADGPILTCTGGGGGWLTTDQEYGDFELRVDYRIMTPGGNSGVGLRYPPQGDPAHEGMEIQILDDPAPEYKDLDPAQYTGGIYYQSPPSAHPARPVGQWNRYFIRCRGTRVFIQLNGVTIQDVDLATFKVGRGGHKALAERPLRGFVGLQSHTGRVDFRNVEIRPIQ